MTTADLRLTVILLGASDHYGRHEQSVGWRVWDDLLQAAGRS